MATTALRTGLKLSKGRMLFSVYWWELLAILQRPLVWLTAIFLLFFFVSLAWGTRGYSQSYFTGEIDPTNGAKISIGINSSTFSGLGLIQTMPYAMLVLGFFLPLFCTTLVSQDLSKRNHELYMSTSVPSHIYVLGRYLVGIILSFWVSTLVIPAYAIVHLFNDINVEGNELNIQGLFYTWSAIMLPAVLIIASLSFALGTLLVKLPNVARVSITASWFFCYFLFAFLLPLVPGMQNMYRTLQIWDPTRATIQKTYEEIYFTQLKATGFNSDNYLDMYSQALRLLASTPDLWPWLWPQLILVAINIGLVFLVAFRFHRYRNYL